MNDKIINDLIGLLAKELRMEASKIGPDTPLFEGGLELDSFATVELIGILEERHGIHFTDADFHPDTFKTVGTLANVVAKYTDA